MFVPNISFSPALQEKCIKPAERAAACRTSTPAAAPTAVVTPTSAQHACQLLVPAYHGNNGAAADVVHQTTEERLAGEISIVLLCQGALNVHELQALQCVAALLKPLDDVANKATLNAIRLR